MNLLELVKLTMEDMKSNNVVVIDFNNTSSLCDAFVIGDAQSLRQVYAIAQKVEDTLLENGFEIQHPLKHSDSGWVLIDAGDVIVHVFQTQERAHYNLEKLYSEFIND